MFSMIRPFLGPRHPQTDESQFNMCVITVF
jgi:hypothetical protein